MPLPDTLQRAFAFGDDSAAESGSRPAGPSGFLDDDPRDIFVGEERLEKYLKKNRLGWVVKLRSVMEELDYEAMLSRYDALGRRAYPPRLMVSLIVYGMLQGQWSLRELELLAVRDVGAWWICGGHQPDHSAIGKFIQRHEDLLSEDFFVELTQHLFRKLKLKPGTVAGDGTVVEAAASRYRALRLESLRARAEEAAQEAESEPEDEGRQGTLDQALEAVRVAEERTEQRRKQGKDPSAIRVAPTEPSAVMQPRKDGARRPSYKPSVLVHGSGLIVAQGVHRSSETAMVDPLLEQHGLVVGGAPNRVLLDAGYCTPQVIKPLVEMGIDLLCPSGRARGDADFEKRGHKGKFAKSEFGYEAGGDRYECPAGQWLGYQRSGVTPKGRKYRVYRCAVCKQCELRSRCTTARAGRTIKRYEGEEYKEAMREVFANPRAREAYRERAHLAERPFSQIKYRQGLQRFHRRGDRGVAVEWSLHVMACNLRHGLRLSQAIFAAFWIRIPGDSWRCIAIAAISAENPANR